MERVGSGKELHNMAAELFPLNRSITGEGLRRSLRILGRGIPLEIHSVLSGSPVLDWHIPDEWFIDGGTLSAADGTVLADWRENNLCVVNYSVPVDAVMTREELAPFVHTLPAQPDLTPYRTSYYAANWGFCLPHSLWSRMGPGPFHAKIDSRIERGVLNYGECFIAGEEEAEVLISVHCCHPSLANDNLSGMVVAAALARRQSEAPRRLGYRFLFLPATIGAITWLARNEDKVGRIQAGLVLTCVGDGGPFHYKLSRNGDTLIDQTMRYLMRDTGRDIRVLPFSPYGYDERQYCSPGFDLPVGCLMRAVHGQFEEYHTSADNLSFVTPDALEQSFDLIAEALDILDENLTFERVDGRGEPQLGRRGLYRAISGAAEAGGPSQLDLLWVLNLADGKHSLLDIAERSGRPFKSIQHAAKLALEANLLRRTDPC